jgi:hypothetical protein
LESNKTINYVLKKNNVPFIVIVGGYGTEFHADKIRSEFTNTLYRPPRFLIEKVQERVQNLKKISKAKGFKFFNDYLARLDSFKVTPDNLLVLKFSKTDYFTFSALHNVLDVPIVIRKQPSSLRSILNENPFEFEHSMLPNPLAVVISLILEPERKIVFIKRSQQNFEGSGLLSTPIAGSISLNSGDVNTSHFSPDPIRTTIKETQEEVGLKIKESQITFFGLGRNLNTLKPEMIGEIRLKITEKEFKEIILNKTHKDEWETERRFFLELLPENVMPYLRDPSNWNPAGWACSLLSLIRYIPNSIYQLK